MAATDHLDKLIQKMTRKGSYENNCINVPRLKFSDLDKILGSTKTLLLTEPTLAVAKTPSVIVGDIHGQYGDLLKAFMTVRTDVGKIEDIKGSKCMTLLCLLKLRYPNRYTLLRGNHECREINMTYGFHDEIAQKYPDGDEATKLYELFNDVFDCLPLAALLRDGRILCMHGGISKSIGKLEQINEIRRPLPEPLSINIACDLLWADPVFGIKGYEPNAIRGVSDSFGEDVLQEFLAKHDLKMIVRGHQMMSKGFGFFSDRRLVTVFTATSYCPGAPEPNSGAVMLVSRNGEFGFRMMLPIKNAQRTGKGWFDKKFDREDTAGDYRVVKRA